VKRAAPNPAEGLARYKVVRPASTRVQQNAAKEGAFCFLANRQT
jgi:hypothetical protein